MIKYIQKQVVVNAVIYEPDKGLEDGFSYGIYDENESDNILYLSLKDLASYRIPFIMGINFKNEPDQYIRLEEGDYIVSDEWGNKRVYKPEEFESVFEQYNFKKDE